MPSFMSRGIGAPLEELPVEDDLALGDVAGQVRDGVGDIVVGHREEGYLRYRALRALDPARALVERGQVGIEVARVALARGNLAARRGDLAERLAIVGHVREDDQYVHPQVVGEVFRGGEGAARRHEALDRGAVGEGEEHDHAREDARALEGVDEEARHVVLDAHAREDDREGVASADMAGAAGVDRARAGGEDPRLPHDLGREPVVGQAVAREDRQLLSSDEGVHPVDGRYPGLEEVPRVDAGRGIYRGAVHVAPVRRDDLRIAVGGPAQAVEDAAEEVSPDAKLEGAAEELEPRLVEREPGVGGEELHGDLLVGAVHDPARPPRPVPAVDRHELAEAGGLPGGGDHDRALGVSEPPMLQSPHLASSRA
jgi:hypothetical protein